MVSVEKLTDVIADDAESIMTILENIGITDIKFNPCKNEIRCSREQGRNPSSVAMNVHSLFYKCFSTGESGNLYTLVMEKTGRNFYDTLIWIAELLNIEGVNGSEKRQYPFGGFYRKFSKSKVEPELNMNPIDESLLDEYKGCLSYMFWKDGISYETQTKFEIGYDFFTNRITIPQRDVYGRLVGVMGRLNSADCDSSERWLPVIPCKRGLTVYGFNQNYKHIIDKKILFIGESEKFVMQLDSMGIHNALATCGFEITNQQARRIKNDLPEVKKIVICDDEGLSEEKIREQAKKLQRISMAFKNKVGYVWDEKGMYLPKGSKSSPSDFGLDVLKLLCRDCLKWVE